MPCSFFGRPRKIHPALFAVSHPFLPPPIFALPRFFAGLYFLTPRFFGTHPFPSVPSSHQFPALYYQLNLPLSLRTTTHQSLPPSAVALLHRANQFPRALHFSPAPYRQKSKPWGKVSRGEKKVVLFPAFFPLAADSLFTGPTQLLSPPPDS